MMSLVLVLVLVWGFVFFFFTIEEVHLLISMEKEEYNMKY